MNALHSVTRSTLSKTMLTSSSSSSSDVVATVKCSRARGNPTVGLRLRARASGGAVRRRAPVVRAVRVDDAVDSFPTFERRRDEDDVPSVSSSSDASSLSVLTALALTNAGVLVDVPAAFAAKGDSNAAGALIDPFYAFSPVCPASDGVFRVGQRAAIGLAGDENIENYRPLINDVLIRVRTELCVLESFVRETAVPFVREKGVGWVFPAHETSETYLAGVVFMLGANFILLGSTKVVAIMAIYHDLSLGLMTRLAGGALGALGPENEEEKREAELAKVMDEQMVELKKVMSNWTMGKDARAKKTQEINDKYAAKLEEIRGTQEAKSNRDDSSGLSKIRRVAGVIAVPLKVYGTVSSKGRQVLEVFDTFCSRYFVAFTVTYIIAKTAHYTIFPDIFG